MIGYESKVRWAINSNGTDKLMTKRLMLKIQFPAKHLINDLSFQSQHFSCLNKNRLILNK